MTARVTEQTTIDGLPAELAYHTKLHVKFTLIDPAIAHRYRGTSADGWPTLCPGCTEKIDTIDERHILTGGDKTGARTSAWHERCFLAAATDPARIWILVAQQVARNPRAHSVAEVRLAITQLVKLASAGHPDPFRVEVEAATPYAVVRTGQWAAPEVNDDGSVTFRQADQSEGPF
jgi:hypothetical protein